MSSTRTTQHTITLSHTPPGWMAHHTDPAVRRLFGSDTVPTPFHAAAAAEEVLATIRRLNPDRLVRLATPAPVCSGTGEMQYGY